MPCQSSEIWTCGYTVIWLRANIYVLEEDKDFQIFSFSFIFSDPVQLNPAAYM